MESAQRKRKLELKSKPRRFPAYLSKAVRGALLEIARRPALASAWTEGRQGTGYEKLDLRAAVESGELADVKQFMSALLADARVSLGVKVDKWDAYLLRYREGAFVPEHKDPTEDEPHLRLNAIVLPASGTTGQLRFHGDVFPLEAGDAVLFRPDVIAHRVTPVEGERVVFSLGCVYIPADTPADR